MLFKVDCGVKGVKPGKRIPDGLLGKKHRQYGAVAEPDKVGGNAGIL
jgi:hypothetical protein